jgi:3-deoxy-manno-octulosonate cytidylyltransferase (CMP-KDO synthetase)
VQGDEPLIPAVVINQLAHNLAQRPSARIATLCEPINEREALLNPNVVKVVFDNEGKALYFSRAPIPWERDAFAGGEPTATTTITAQRHLGIYAYRAGFLHQFVQWPEAELEKIECLEQLRAMAHGVKIHVQLAAEPLPPGVDTQEDLDHVRSLLEA